MSGEAAITSYSIPEPFEDGLGTVREALTDRKLKIIGQLDLSNRIRRRLRIRLEPCVVFYVWPSAPLLRSMAPLPEIGLMLPLHVVVSAHSRGTEVHLLKRPRTGQDAGTAVMDRVLAEVVQAIETVGMRRTLVS